VILEEMPFWGHFLPTHRKRDSDELREKADELVQAMPEKLKNQGRRLVSIRTSRGAAVKVAAPYYSRKKKKNKRRKKKKK
jgi:hypothetical protein